MSAENWGQLLERTPQQANAIADMKAQLCARVFTSLDGVDLLALMRLETIERTLNASSVSESALRALAAQSQFVRELELARDRGLAALARKQEPPPQ